MSKCIGCGITLQNDYKNKLGYTANLDNLYCERCFRTIHYNEERKITNLDNSKIIEKISKLNLFTIFITDIVNLNLEVINTFKKIPNKKVLVINKCDMIPSNVKLEHLSDNIKNSYNLEEDVFFISAKKELYLNKIIDIIEEYKDVIFCGETSCGKSTLINHLIGSKLTTSNYQNTTLDFIKLNYMSYHIYDTPGILLKNYSNNSKKLIIKNIQMDNDYVLTVNDLKIRSNGNFTLFVPDNVTLTSKKDNTLLEEIKLDSKVDILLPMGGFIYVKDSCIVKASKLLEIRKSIIGR